MLVIQGYSSINVAGGSMKRISTQTGLTLTSFIIVLCVVGFFIFIAMKLVPIYTEYNSVVTDMEGLAEEAKTQRLSPEEIRVRLGKRFNISFVDSVKPENIKITKVDGGYDLQIAYEVRKHMMYNIDVVAVFDKTVTLSSSSQ